ncbi:MAG TPA: hypothetical protein VM451_04000 [Candidatus Limnocylindria bacterium]|nr:hypothetical protein [Candidatus Limnocylindria bacterium]
MTSTATHARSLFRARPRARFATAAAALVLALAACSNAGSGGSATTGATTVPASAGPTGGIATPDSTVVATGATVNLATNGILGAYITAANGMSLYLFTPDEDDKSTCTGGCAQAWPAYTVPDGTTVNAGEGVTGTVGTFKRDDGTMQVTIDKQPLYFFSGDAAAGDVKGQGVNEVWYLVKPSGDQLAGGKGTY